ncbi:MAG: hypothetical protein HOP30_09520 [Cyclobacteriaceae bacterium]|nr:hypothetical protein [Cyclobacteriaceae bacterium]
MATQIKTKKAAKSKALSNTKGKDYGNAPFFVKKAKESKAFLEKNGFPEAILKKR